MKANLSLYFYSEADREEWKRAVETQISIYTPKITYKIQDIEITDGYHYGCSIIYNGGTKYNIVGRGIKYGSVSLKFTNKETGEDTLVEYNPEDIGYYDYQLLCFD